MRAVARFKPSCSDRIHPKLFHPSKEVFDSRPNATDTSVGSFCFLAQRDTSSLLSHEKLLSITFSQVIFVFDRVVSAVNENCIITRVHKLFEDLTVVDIGRVRFGLVEKIMELENTDTL